MKKFMSRILGIILVVTLVFSSVPSMAGANIIDSYLPEYDSFATKFSAEFVANYTRAVELLYGFYDSLLRNRSGEVMYPCDFGGIYISTMMATWLC